MNVLLIRYKFTIRQFNLIMIIKINKIKNLGLVFLDYSWDTSLQPFRRFNLIFGGNGSGKTTLSRFFDAIGGVQFERLEYEIEDTDGSKYNQGEKYLKNIRVFNQDYIQNNVKILEGKANTISILLGEKNKELEEEIDRDKALLNGDPNNPTMPGKLIQYSEHVKEIKIMTASREDKFTEIAKTIGAAIGGNALRTYRKPQAEEEFLLLPEKAELSKSLLDKYLLGVSQTSLPKIPLLEVKKVSFDVSGEEFDLSKALELIDKTTLELMRKTVVSEVISRLVTHKDISKWVEDGLRLHNSYSSDKCEYCTQQVPKERIEQLANHFNEADKKLKEDLDELIIKLRKIYTLIQSSQINNRMEFYSDLRDSFDTQKLIFESAREDLLSSITSYAEELKNKKAKTTEAIGLNTAITIKDFLLCINEVNKIIKMHNKTTTDFEAVKTDATVKLKNHYLSTIYDDVKKIDAEMFDLKEKAKSLDQEIISIRGRIVENTAQISSKHKACEVINNKIATFLGHQELTFVPHTQKETDKNGVQKEIVTGYQIMRGGNKAMYLSEGEKTAIAFVYFVVHLGDEEFNIENGIIIIDDPISSLDSNSQYQAFSFLINAVKNGGQVFIFTHNFDFLKLLINWRRHAGGAGYYMIKNKFSNNMRCAYIATMDKELYEYESEYHYLFKLLKNMLDEHDDTIAKAYHIPNIARKVWDTFLMFSVPNGKSSYKKMDELKEAGFDQQKLDAIYKFTNDQSHITGSGFDPTLVPEAKKVVNELFEMMEKISPEHFRIIVRATSN